MTIVIEPHALKHGLSANEVTYAWETLLECRMRLDERFPPRWIGLGVLPDGRLTQLVATEGADGVWHVFHAMTPPTKVFLKELGLKG
ncbi:MAG: hypothetical protein PUK59_03375 [Actinomycetaceae bacterium]|nr:hypothetical protein [Actinomycetaceae bacterium]MDY5854382.1 hypothetical protein [Arcanobacterium sp.]